jgi:hypothetical protein
MLFWPLRAAAAPSVTWHAPSECPAPSEGRADVAQLLGKKLADIDSELSLSVRIARVSASEFEASVVIGTGRSARERLLRDARCDVLTHAAAVVVALAIDPAASLGEGEHAPARRSAAESVPAGRTNAAGAIAATTALDVGTQAPAAESAGASRVESASPTTSASASASSRAASSVAAAAAATAVQPAEHRETAEPEAAEQQAEDTPAPADSPEPPRTSPGLGLFFAAGGGAAVGMLPQLAPSAALSFGVLGAGWRAALRIGYAPAQHATLDDPPGVGGRVSLANIAAEGGFRWQWGRLEVPLVAGLESGFFVAEGEGVETHAPELAAWLASYLSSGASYALTRVFCLGFRVEALVALRRPQFAVESSAGQQYPFYRPAPLGGRLFVELEVRLP